MSQANALEEFRETHYLEVSGAKVCYRKAGSGPALVLFHGYPLTGWTWRKLVPELSRHFTCYAFDLVGLGGSNSSDRTDFTSPGQGRVFQRALRALGVESYALMGNDSGGWVAREVAVLEPERVTRLLLTNTEIPNHRPPTVWLYQRMAQVPGGSYLFRSLLATSLWRKSHFGLGGCFHDPDLVDEPEFFNSFLAPLLESHERLLRALKFLVLMQLIRVDDFTELHKRLTMPTAFVWGEDDPTFEEPSAREMAKQFPNVVSFTSIPKAKLFLHEEFVEETLRP
ncbi:MAG TPA: alpha/beta hydrolase, partial [Pyrinomonadaceae bacterium]